MDTQEDLLYGVGTVRKKSIKLNDCINLRNVTAGLVFSLITFLYVSRALVSQVERTVVSLALTFLVIPHDYDFGAAWVALGAESSVVVVVRTFYRLACPFGGCVRYSAGTAVVVVAALGIQRILPNTTFRAMVLPAKAGVGTLGYFVMMAFTRGACWPRLSRSLMGRGAYGRV